MNIDTIISNLHPILLDIVNPTDIDIVNKLIVSIDSIVYKKQCEPIDIYENCILLNSSSFVLIISPSSFSILKEISS